MWEWLKNSIGTIVVVVLLLAAVVGVVLKMVRDRKNGKSGCGYGCGSCPAAKSCHSSNSDRKSEEEKA